MQPTSGVDHELMDVDPTPVKIQLMSDLHLEFPFKTPQGETVEGYEIFECTPSAPYLALLGDIGLCNDSGLFTFLGRQLKKYSKIFFVMGNHEGYHSSYTEARMQLSSFTAHIQKQREKEYPLGEFIFLDRTRYDISDTVTILGCTLWSNVHQTAEGQVAMLVNDFRFIKDWSVKAYKEAHNEDVQWLSQQCSEIKTKEPHRRVIVLTHHAPSYINTSSPKYGNSPINSAFATEMTRRPLWDFPLVAWAFGHTHWNCDFVHKGVRIVSNQRGYESYGGTRTFREEKIVSV